MADPALVMERMFALEDEVLKLKEELKCKKQEIMELHSKFWFCWKEE
jgi:hypothetical protein